MLNELQFVGALRSNWISGAHVIYNPTSTNEFYEVGGLLRIPAQTADVPFISKVHFTEKLDTAPRPNRNARTTRSGVAPPKYNHTHCSAY